MTKDFEFRIDGLDELEKNLLDLAREYGPRNARNAFNVPMKKALAVVEEKIIADTPMDTGELKQSVKIKTGRGPVLKSRLNWNIASPGGKDKIVAAAHVGWYGQSSYKLLAVEYGTRKKSRPGVVRRALRTKAGHVMKTFRTEFAKNLTKTANRLSKRKKLGKLKVR